MQIFYSATTTLFVLLHLFSHLILISAECSSSCKENSANDVNRTNLSDGNSLEEAVIDAILKQSKINSRVELRHFEIPKITKNMLKNISSVIISIDFQSNKITEIENGSFDEMSKKLEKIDLMENCLRKITKHIFSDDFSELQEINLSFNAINSIEAGSFDRFIKLSSIDLSNNCVKHLHSNLFRQNDALREVHLQHNEITKIEFHVLALKAELNIFDLSYNNLDFIPQFKTKNIQHLNVSHNKLIRFDLNYEFSHKAHLEALDASHNNISACAKGIRKDIVRLDLSYNQIIDLSEFPVLLNLELLQISNNKNLSDLWLEKFDERFSNLRILNISETSIQCNEFKYLRKAFPSISISTESNFVTECRNFSSYDDHFITKIINSKHDEILMQLKLNRSLLITLLSILTVFVSIPIVFLLRNHCFSIKHSKTESLIEQIEL
ncbi:hypothetical protein PVAND_010996 [Polypedilum vanderplanki]|uniref:Uncharacterized protein n=1 Tax=Polypedilum vanderplanki TaxID=319348 RepID=A0A9J6CHA4_POLVA|nr:hypothetical protein PVAND_010996 [Polypedilum vanderplanki]